MQVAQIRSVRPVRPVPASGSAAESGTRDRATVIRPSTSLSSVALPSVSTALRVVESLLLSGGPPPARRNAWTAVQEDRRRAKDRVEAQHVLEAVSDRTSRAT
jgi:hypothetical protein